MLKKAICLLAICSAATSSELDQLIDSSSAIVDQIDRGIKLAGAAQGYAHQGTGLSDGTLSQTAHITSEHLQAYNNALMDFANNYLPYGSLQQVLEEKAQQELTLLNDSVDTFSEVVVEIMHVQEVAEMSETASSPQEEAQVQEYVAANSEMLVITEEQASTYSQSLDDIESHANNASAYIAVAANTEAVSFLQQGAENNNTTAEQATLSYSANMQWVKMSWSSTNNASAVYLNGNDGIGLDLYVTEAEVLLAGSESEYYLSSPIAQGYNCFMYGENCE